MLEKLSSLSSRRRPPNNQWWGGGGGGCGGGFWWQLYRRNYTRRPTVPLGNGRSKLRFVGDECVNYAGDDDDDVRSQSVSASTCLTQQCTMLTFLSASSG